MYRLFCNNRCLTIVNFYDNLLTSGMSEMSVDSNAVDNLVDILRKWLIGGDDEDLVLNNVDGMAAAAAIKSLFRQAPAAGGLVKYGNNIVAIERNGKPDFPKGHIEKNESPEAAALREVEEETGMKKLSILRALPSTWHCYFFDNQWVLKKTYWYLMSSSSQNDFKPQREEGITKVFMIDKDNVHAFLRDTYPSLSFVLAKDILEVLGVK